jgi:methionine--tRNA ligase beta chain
MKPTIAYPDFEKLDIRAGRVTAANLLDWSHKLVELTVDFGEEIGSKTVLSGVSKWYSPADFEGHTYAFIVNLAERKMGEGVSQGMMLMADTTDKPVPFSMSNEVSPGTVIR